MLDKLGGRKFLMALFVLGIGAFIDVRSEKGISTEMVALITAIYATFSASNAMLTSKELSVGSLVEKVSEVVNLPAKDQTISVEEELAAPSPPPAGPSNEQLVQQMVPILNQISASLNQLDGQQKQQAVALNSTQKALAALLQNAE
jgi:hypothetical protein